MPDPKKEQLVVDRALLESNGFKCHDQATPPAWKTAPWYHVEADGIVGYGESVQAAYNNWFSAKRSTGKP